jgi:hypothetical protein
MRAFSAVVRAAVALAPLAMILAYVPVQAAAPPNDDIGAAIEIAALPYSSSVDITEATNAAGDLDCSGLLDEHTVWYRYQPAADTVLGIRMTSSVNELSLAIGSGGALALEYCSFSSEHLFAASGGATYFLQVASCCGAEPGPVDITIQELQPLTVNLEIDSMGTVDPDTGAASVSGTIACDRTTPPGSELVVQGTLTQRHGRSTAEGWLVPVHLTTGCSPTPAPWQATTQLLSTSGFTRGKAVLSATGFACDDFQYCATPDSVTGPVRLR